MPACKTIIHRVCSPQVHYLLHPPSPIKLCNNKLQIANCKLQIAETRHRSMATMVVGVGLPFGLSSSPPQKKKALKNYTLGNHSTRRLVAVRAEGGGAINPEIRKTEEKVVDAVVVTELAKPVTAYCRCWRSGTFPLCDGGHVKHNKATGDNVGPLVLKK